jgi:hypothetical protein
VPFRRPLINEEQSKASTLRNGLLNAFNFCFLFFWAPKFQARSGSNHYKTNSVYQSVANPCYLIARTNKAQMYGFKEQTNDSVLENCFVFTSVHFVHCINLNYTHNTRAEFLGVTRHFGIKSITTCLTTPHRVGSVRIWRWKHVCKSKCV